jgi:hypothetical protein
MNAKWKRLKPWAAVPLREVSDVCFALDLGLLCARGILLTLVHV